MHEKQTPETDIIAGRNAVLETLRSGRPVDSVFLSSGERGGSLSVIAAMCRERGIPVKQASAEKLSFKCGHVNHQGVVAVIAAESYVTVDELLRRAEERGEPPFLILCDGLEDPHNLGAVIRTAEAAGAHGVIVPKRHSVGLTAAVAKASAGAVAYLPVARVSNLAQTIDQLKERGIWIYGADMEGSNWCGTDLAGPVGLVVGSEGFGISRLVREKCDFLLSLPMKGKINSLNASVAAGILMYEAARQRAGLRAK